MKPSNASSATKVKSPRDGVFYDPVDDEICLVEPGFIGAVDGYRFIKPLDIETDSARIVTDKKEIARLVYVGEM